MSIKHPIIAITGSSGAGTVRTVRVTTASSRRNRSLTRSPGSKGGWDMGSLSSPARAAPATGRGCGIDVHGDEESRVGLARRVEHAPLKERFELDA